jgi:hypothetical protein
MITPTSYKAGGGRLVTTLLPTQSGDDSPVRYNEASPELKTRELLVEEASANGDGEGKKREVQRRIEEELDGEEFIDLIEEECDSDDVQKELEELVDDKEEDDEGVNDGVNNKEHAVGEISKSLHYDKLIECGEEGMLLYTRDEDENVKSAQLMCVDGRAVDGRLEVDDENVNKLVEVNCENVNKLVEVNCENVNKLVEVNCEHDGREVCVSPKVIKNNVNISLNVPDNNCVQAVTSKSNVNKGTNNDGSITEMQPVPISDGGTKGKEKINNNGVTSPAPHSALIAAHVNSISRVRSSSSVAGAQCTKLL